MERRRFIPGLILSVFAYIDRKDWKPVDKDRVKRRQFNKLGGFAYKPNGARECARRVRQIEAGSLRVENGLV